MNSEISPARAYKANKFFRTLDLDADLAYFLRAIQRQNTMETMNMKGGMGSTEMLGFTPSSIQTDMTEEDQNDSLRSYSCKYHGCDKTFRYRSEILRHMVTHTNHRPYVCPYKDCCKGFKRSDALATHIRIHTGDKPFMCPVGSCQLAFSTKAGLRYHILKHKNNKLYKCDYPGCDQSFLTMSQLKQHKRGTKIHEILQSPNLPTAENLRNPTVDNYEPAIQKRVQTDPIQASAQQFSILEMKIKTTKFESEKGGVDTFSSAQNSGKQKSDSDITVLQTTSIGTVSANAAMLPMLKSMDDCSEGVCNTFDDQKDLLKKINRVLDENTTLKKHLELCKKIISIYQSNVETSKRPPFC